MLQCKFKCLEIWQSNKFMNNIYFILRHGQTIYQTEKKNEKYPWPEPAPIFLTKKGEKQVRDATRKIKRVKIDKIYSSDAPRARQTAEIVAKETGANVIFDERLRDTNLGVFGGRSKVEYRKFFLDKRERFAKRPPKGESWNDVAKRAVDFFKEIDKNNQSQNILIVSHGDPLWLLEGVLTGLNEQELLKIREQKKGGDFLETAEFRNLNFQS